MLFTFSFETFRSKNWTIVPRILEYKHAQLEYKHVGHRPFCTYLDVTDTPQLSKQQRAFLVLRQQAGLAI